MSEEAFQPFNERTTKCRRDVLKSALLPLVSGTVMLGAPKLTSAQNTRSASRVVVFLSRSGNTRVLAGALARRWGADTFEMRPREPWPADYAEMVEWANRWRSNESDLPLAEQLLTIDQYRTVFLGFPVWGNDLPAVARSFLRSHDLGGKTIVPFITYGSSGIGSSMGSVRRAAPNARFVDPFTLRCDQERSTLESLDSYLGGIQMRL
jgi:flavodoxin